MHLNYKPARWVAIIICLLFIYDLNGQTRAIRKAERKHELIKKLEKKYYEKSRKKAIKHRREIQTEATKKRMEEIDRKARLNNRQSRDIWLLRWMKRKKAKK